MSDGSEFQVCGAATEKARRANSVRVLAADSTGESEDRRGHIELVLLHYLGKQEAQSISDHQLINARLCDDKSQDSGVAERRKRSNDPALRRPVVDSGVYPGFHLGVQI